MAGRKPPSPCSSPPPRQLLFEIPAEEFPNLPSKTPSPSKPPSTTAWERRHKEAAQARQTTLQSIHHRARHHSQHAARVARGVKQARAADSAQRGAQLEDALSDAAERRMRLHASRSANALSNRRVMRARAAREQSLRDREAEAADAHQARREADRRRGRLLSDRRQRAARFSPPRRAGLIDMSAPSDGSVRTRRPRRMSPASSVSGASSPAMSSPTPSSMSIVSQDTEEEAPCSPRHDPPTTPVTPSVARRLEFSSLPNSVLESHAVPPNEMTREQMLAGRRIASYYLLARARAAMTAAGVLGSQLASQSFADTTTHMESESAQRAADLVFRALGKRDRGRRLTRKDVVRERSERRILLSCLLLALHPNAVVEDKIRSPNLRGGQDGPSVDALAVHAARRMLLCLQAGTLAATAASWVEWRRAFLVWKKNDAENFLNAMIEDAIATEALRTAIDRKFSDVENIDGFRSTLGADESVAELHRREHTIWHEQLTMKQHKIRESIVKLAGKSGEEKLDAALTTSRHIKDEHLVHEIMIDLRGLLERVRQTTPVPEHAWQQLRVDLSKAAPGRIELAARLAHIAKALNSMVPSCFVLSNGEVPAHLDVEFAVSIVVRVAEALQKCQAQAFDDILNEWVSSAIQRLRASGPGFVDTVVKVLQELTEFVQKVQTDVLSFRIRHSAPIVRQFGAAWERSRFQGHMVSGTFSSSLPRTRLFLRETLESLGPKGTQIRDDILKGGSDSLRRLMTQGVTRLIAKSEMCTLNDLPEVMHLDLERVIQMQNEAQKCSFLGTLHNIALQFLHSKRVSNPDLDLKDLDNLCASDEARLVDMQDCFISAVHRVTEHNEQELSDDDRALLRSMVERTTRPGDGTFALLHKRVVQCTTEIALESIGDQGKLSGSVGSAPGRTRSMQGLSGVEESLAVLGGKVGRLVSHLLQVHGESLVIMSRAL